MAGWIAVWCKNSERIDRFRWSLSVLAAGRYGDKVNEFVSGATGIAVWRRQKGEFTHNGTCFQPFGDCTMAWVGQCIDDIGETTLEAIHVLARRPAHYDAAAALNGPFAAAVFHYNPTTLTIWTDRYRDYPVYMYRTKNLSIASTELRCLMPWIERPQINRGAVDLMLRCGELIDNMTLIEGVEMLPAAVCITEQEQEIHGHKYWDLNFKSNQTISPSDYAERLAKKLKSSILRIEQVCPKIAVPLSGGLDSRLCLGLCQAPQNIPSFTWGLPRCRDIKYASKFASAIKSPHRVHLWQPENFIPLWNQGVDLTAGAFGVHEMFILPFVEMLSVNCDVVLNGLAGDAFLGGNFLKWSWFNHDISKLADLTWRWRVSPQQDEWVDRLLGYSKGPELWKRSLTRRQEGQRPIEHLHKWLFENRVFRYTNCGTMLLRGQVESHSPFFDRDFVELITQVPLEYKVKHKLYLDVLRRACPKAARVRWQRTAIPPAWGFHANLASMIIHRGIREIFSPFGINPFPAIPVADTANWFRNEWKNETQRILLDERTLERGLFDPNVVREICVAHEQGDDLTRQLGVLVMIELFQRMTIDTNNYHVLNTEVNHEFSHSN